MSLFSVLIIFAATSFVTAQSAEAVLQLKVVAETQLFTGRPFFLHTAADLNGNGRKELVLTDFGMYGNKLGEVLAHEGPSSETFNLYVVEWEKNKLQKRFQKQWNIAGMDSNTRVAYFQGYGAALMVDWTPINKPIVETIPPYLGIEWRHGDYMLYEQVGVLRKGPLIGSWALPWVSPDCYGSFMRLKEMPGKIECLVAMRNSKSAGSIVLVSVQNDKGFFLSGPRRNEDRLNSTVIVRGPSDGFPVLWHHTFLPNHLFSSTAEDKFNLRSGAPLLANVFDGKTLNWQVVNLRGSQSSVNALAAKGSLGLKKFDLSDTYLRTTRSPNQWEYWGYHTVPAPPNSELTSIWMLRSVRLSPDKSKFIHEDVTFPHHEDFLGVGFFRVEDIDGDGVDEIILVEETGKAQAGHENIFYSNTKDYIRILKWNGKTYDTIWISEPITKRGTKFLVEDVIGNGKKQLVVLKPDGKVQVWEKN